MKPKHLQKLFLVQLKIIIDLSLTELWSSDWRRQCAIEIMQENPRNFWTV